MDGKFYVDGNGSLRTITWKDDDDDDQKKSVYPTYHEKDSASSGSKTNFSQQANFNISSSAKRFELTVKTQGNKGEMLELFCMEGHCSL